MNGRTPIASFDIAGNKHASREGQEAFESLTDGDIVELKPEPENEYDSNAISVRAMDDDGKFSVHMGYVPRTENLHIGEILERHSKEGIPLLCTFHFSGTFQIFAGT